MRLADHGVPQSNRPERVGLLPSGPGPGAAGIVSQPPLVLFGAVGGTADPRKGADLLLESLQRLRRQVAGLPQRGWWCSARAGSLATRAQISHPLQQALM